MSERKTLVTSWYTEFVKGKPVLREYRYTATTGASEFIERNEAAGREHQKRKKARLRELS